MLPIQLVAIAVSVGLLLLVVELVRRRILGEEYSLVWIAVAVVLLLLSVWREGMHLLARMLGIYYPPSLLLLVLALLVFVAALAFSVVLSRHRRQIEALIEEVALLDASLRELQRPRAGDAGEGTGGAAPDAGGAAGER